MAEQKRRPGRPQALIPDERRLRILEAAGLLFIQQGFDETNMEQIAQRCGMSKRTVYTVFKSKDALFAALVCDVDSDQHPGKFKCQDEPTAESLFDALYHTAEWVLSPRQIGLARLVISETTISPDLASKFRKQVFELGRKYICNYLKSITSHTKLDYIEEMASILYGATIADLQLQALVGEDIGPALEGPNLSNRIRKVIKLMTDAEVNSLPV